MEILTFDNADDMLAALEEHHIHALDNLHPAQRSIKQGDHWVRFVDVGVVPPVIEFGRVLTAEEIASSMLDDGIPFNEVTDFILEKDRLLNDQGLAWSAVRSVVEPTPQLSSTHVSYVWPVEQRLYDWAQRVDFNVSTVVPRTEVEGEELIGSDAARLLLEIAFQQMRAHYLPGKETQDDDRS